MDKPIAESFFKGVMNTRSFSNLYQGLGIKTDLYMPSENGVMLVAPQDSQYVIYLGGADASAHKRSIQESFGKVGKKSAPPVSISLGGENQNFICILDRAAYKKCIQSRGSNAVQILANSMALKFV